MPAEANPLELLPSNLTPAIQAVASTMFSTAWMAAIGSLLGPGGNVSDAPEEHYEFSPGKLAPGEHTIAVRAYDRFENVGSVKTTFVVPASKP